ncbi:LytTR family DNA-binding domain-containing protein [Dokdonia sp.]|uniref:LytR/AlgR family response regulator transcription factor n=1 Tax=Dokdonia sp. TaxID=2024995 RepID=UPI003263E2F6
MYLLIIEDEIPAFEKLRAHMNHHFNDDFTYDWARSITEATHFLETHTYDLIISDIQLLDGVSFEIFENVTIKTPIIFCSAYDEYLFKAFKSNGIAYILKPYNQEDITQAFLKYKTLFNTEKNNVPDVKVFSEIKDEIKSISSVYKKRFVIKSKKGIHLLETEKIAVVVAEGDFCKLIDCEGKTHLYSQNIGSIYATLDPSKFFRINRSQLVQLNYILEMENHFKNRLLLNVQGVKEKVMTSSGTTANFRIWLDR